MTYTTSKAKASLRTVGRGSAISEVTIGGLTIFFSYATPIAFHTSLTGYVLSENVWTPKTARHLGEVRRMAGTPRTIPAEAFAAEFNAMLTTMGV